MNENGLDVGAKFDLFSFVYLLVLFVLVCSVEATVSVFQDTTCRHLVEKEYFGIGCALSVLDSYYADDNSAYSTSLHCELPSPGNNALVPPTPVSVQAHTYTMQR